MWEAQIVAIEYALPSRIVTNAELEHQHPGWKMGDVINRTGVEARRWVSENETALDLGERACRKLFERLGTKLSSVDTILFCTQSPDHSMPPNATLLQCRLGFTKHVAALDYTLACSGYVYGLYLAKALIRSGMSEGLLLVTAETYSKWMHPEDRGPMTLFGDGAAATLILPGNPGIGEIVLGSDGSAAKCFMVPAGGARQPSSADTKMMISDKNDNHRTLENLYMNGAAVLDFIKREVPSSIALLLKRSGFTMDDIDLVIFHQASKVTLDVLQKALHLPPAKLFSNISQVGNTVSASIPIALKDAENSGLLKPNMRVLLSGFGVGLSWGACIIQWS